MAASLVELLSPAWCSPPLAILKLETGCVKNRSFQRKTSILELRLVASSSDMGDYLMTAVIHDDDDDDDAHDDDHDDFASLHSRLGG